MYLIIEEYFLHVCLQEGSSPVTAAHKISQIHPYIIIVGSLQCPQQLFVAAEQHVFFEVIEDNFPGSLLAAYYVCNT